MALAGIPRHQTPALVPRRWLERILVQSLFDRCSQVRIEGLAAGLPELDTVVFWRIVTRCHCDAGVGVLPRHRPSDSRRRRPAEVYTRAALPKDAPTRLYVRRSLRVPVDDHRSQSMPSARPTESANSAVTVSPTGPRIPLVRLVITLSGSGRP